MAWVHLTLEEDVLKGRMLGKREEAVTKLLEQVFNSVLRAQATEQLNAEPYEHSDEQTRYRDGSRTRMPATRVRYLVLHVPKFRDGTLGADLFSSYQHSEQALLLSLMEMVNQGVSTRKISEITVVYSLPEPYRKRPRTSNSIQRLNEELRRRERFIQKRPSVRPSHWKKCSGVLNRHTQGYLRQ